MLGQSPGRRRTQQDARCGPGHSRSLQSRYGDCSSTSPSSRRAGNLGGEKSGFPGQGIITRRQQALANPPTPTRSCGADLRVWRPGSAQFQGTANPVGRRPASCSIFSCAPLVLACSQSRCTADRTQAGRRTRRRQAKRGWLASQASIASIPQKKKCTTPSLSHRLPWHLNHDVALDGDARPAMARGRSSPAQPNLDLVPNGLQPTRQLPPPCLIATKLTLNVLATAYARHATPSRLAVDHPNGRLPARDFAE